MSHTALNQYLYAFTPFPRYVSVVIDCPYSGKVDPVKVKEVTQALLDMGCYEVSLGDTVGTGNPTTVGRLLKTVLDGGIPASVLAVRTSLRR